MSGDVGAVTTKAAIHSALKSHADVRAKMLMYLVEHKFATLCGGREYNWMVPNSGEHAENRKQTH